MTAASESEYPSPMSTDLCGERHSDNLPHHRVVDLANGKRRSAVTLSWSFGLCMNVSDSSLTKANRFCSSICQTARPMKFKRLREQFLTTSLLSLAVTAALTRSQ